MDSKRRTTQKITIETYESLQRDDSSQNESREEVSNIEISSYVKPVSTQEIEDIRDRESDGNSLPLIP